MPNCVEYILAFNFSTLRFDEIFERNPSITQKVVKMLGFFFYTFIFDFVGICYWHPKFYFAKSQSIVLLDSVISQFLFILQGFVCGDVIGILMPNCVEYVLAFTGAAGVGMTTTTFNPAYTPAEVSRQIKTSKAKVMLTNSAFAKTVLDAIKLSGM